MIPTPDLLHEEPRLEVDYEQLRELLGLAFTGRADAEGLDRALSASPGAETAWDAEQFANDLFVRELIREHYKVRFEGNTYSPNAAFLYRVLTQPPTAQSEIRFRQQIVRELWDDPDLYDRTLRHYVRLYDLVNMFKVPGQMARLDINTFRLDLFRQVKGAIDEMVNDFEQAESGLRRMHEVGLRIRASREYEILTALLDHADDHASLNVDLGVGANGKITRMRINEVRINEDNRFYQGRYQRFVGKLKSLLWYGFRLDDQVLFNRLVQEIYDRLATSIMGLGQLLGHLEVYLTQHQFRQRAEERGLPICLAEIRDQGSLELDDLFNPLLLGHATAPVPCTLHRADARTVHLVTGPNSGGKTRLLQAVGLAQLLGQGGFYVTAEKARLIQVRGIFVSLIEHEAVDHSEGRLGRELERIRSMFDSMRVPSMVILDELCSGTNPSEGTEVFSLVLRLLEKVRPVGWITTHFLDYARNLEADPPVRGLSFLQVDVDAEQRSTFQFVPGVAGTSLAALMAERMGVTFDAISEALDTQMDADEELASGDAASGGRPDGSAPPDESSGAPVLKMVPKAS